MCPETLKKGIKKLIPPAFWLGVWQIGAKAVGQELLLPSPLSVFRALMKLAPTAPFWLAVGASLGRILSGLAVGCALGTGLAGLTFRFQWAKLLLAPAVRVVRATPVVCFILLCYLWVARARIPAVIAAMMVMPVMWGNVEAGLEAVDGKLLEMARAYRFSRFQTLRLIYLPSLRPYFSSALLTAMGLSWKSGVAAEVICPPARAIGTEIGRAKTALETPELFAWTLVIIALSLALEGLFRYFLLERGREGGRST